MLTPVEHEKSFIALGPALGARLHHNCHSQYKKLFCILRKQPNHDDV